MGKPISLQRRVPEENSIAIQLQQEENSHQSDHIAKATKGSLSHAVPGAATCSGEAMY